MFCFITFYIFIFPADIWCQIIAKRKEKGKKSRRTVLKKSYFIYCLGIYFLSLSHNEIVIFYALYRCSISLFPFDTYLFYIFLSFSPHTHTLSLSLSLSLWPSISVHRCLELMRNYKSSIYKIIFYRYVRRRGVGNPLLLAIPHCLQICEKKGGWQSSSTGNTALSTDI